MVTETNEYQGTMRWFGRAFDAPMYEGMPEVPTPVGNDCLGCGEPILDGEPGITMPFQGEDGVSQEPWHIECHLRSILGSPAHMARKCSCFRGLEAVSTQSYREQAREVVAHFWGPEWTDA